MFTRVRRAWGEDRRGAIVVLVAVVGTLMAGFAALTIDMGVLYIARTELQRGADAAAIAGASAYLTHDALADNAAGMTSLARERSNSIAGKNTVLKKQLVLNSSDIKLGYHDFSKPGALLSSAAPWNAVQVTVRCTKDSVNGPVSLLFAHIWGKASADVVATARAAFNDNVAGYKLEGNTSGTGFMPFTIPVDAYYDLISTGGLDEYTYDESVKNGTDGVREVVMYPWKWPETAGPGGSGNFGILDMNRPNNGASELSTQISNGGASAADVQAQFQTSTLTFYDATHTASSGPITYSCSGTPGMKTSIQKALSDQTGRVFGFFLNNGVTGNGQNATYSICGVFFARIMAVDISGGKKACGLVIQPVGYADRWVVVSSSARSTERTLGRIMLVQ